MRTRRPGWKLSGKRSFDPGPAADKRFDLKCHDGIIQTKYILILLKEETNMDASWLNLEGKTFIVTGGASGIGLTVTRELLADGANVVVCDMNPNPPEELTEEKKVTYIVTNVTSAESVNAMVAKPMETYGRIDGIVNNAGINIRRLLVDEGHEYELDEAV